MESGSNPRNDESDAAGEVLRQLAALQAKFAPRHGGLRRTFHVKTIAGAAGVIDVLGGLPEALRHGLLAGAARYPVAVRFSSGQSWEQADWVPDIRGMAVRVEDIADGSGALRSQDFIAVNGNIRFARNAREFSRLVSLMQSMATVPLHIGREISLRQALALGRDFAGIAARTLRCLSDQSFHCVAPILAGHIPVKVAFRPRGRHRRRAGRLSPNGLRDSIDTWLTETELAWDVLVQPYRDEVSTPVDDLTVRWDERASPFVQVATLTLSRRGRAAANALRQAIEAIAFNPCNALPEHAPVGSIQALRGAAYAASAAARRSTGGVSGGGD